MGEANLFPKVKLGDLLASPSGKCLEQTRLLDPPLEEKTLPTITLAFLPPWELDERIRLDRWF